MRVIMLQQSAFPFQHVTHSFEQFHKAKRQGGATQSIQLFVEVLHFIRQLPRVTQYLLNVRLQPVWFDPHHAILRVTFLLLNLDGEGSLFLIVAVRVFVGTDAKISGWDQFVDVTQPWKGLRAGLEQGNHQIRLLFTVGPRVDHAVPLVADNGQSYFVFTSKTAVQKHGERGSLGLGFDLVGIRRGIGRGRVFFADSCSIDVEFLRDGKE